MTIRTKNKDPKSTEFSPNDIVINTKDGVLFYKSDTGLFKVQGDNINTSVTESASTTSTTTSIPDGTISSSLQNLGNITGSNISASGDLYVSGDIGIGTDSPSDELEVFKTGENAVIAITRGTATQLKLKAQDTKTRITYEGGPLIIDRDESGTNTLTLGAGGDITASEGSHISASATSTGSFGRLECLTISASTGEFDDDSIKIGGESLNKSNLVNLKAGRPITTASANLLREDSAESDDTSTKFIKVEALVHENDNRTFLKFKSPARIATFVSGVLFQDLNNLNTNNYFKVGVGTTNLILSGSITGSIINGGSF